MADVESRRGRWGNLSGCRGEGALSVACGSSRPDATRSLAGCGFGAGYSGQERCAAGVLRSGENMTVLSWDGRGWNSAGVPVLGNVKVCGAPVATVRCRNT